MKSELRKNKSTKGWFRVENLFMEECASFLKPYTSMVYLLLLRYKNNETNECFPSQKTIASKLGVSRRNVIRSIKTLWDLGFIKVYYIENKNKWNNNSYEILEPDNWIRPSDNMSHTPYDNNDSLRVTEGNTNNTHKYINTNKNIVSSDWTDELEELFKNNSP